MSYTHIPNRLLYELLHSIIIPISNPYDSVYTFLPLYYPQYRNYLLHSVLSLLIYENIQLNSLIGDLYLINFLSKLIHSSYLILTKLKHFKLIILFN